MHLQMNTSLRILKRKLHNKQLFLTQLVQEYILEGLILVLLENIIPSVPWQTFAYA